MLHAAAPRPVQSDPLRLAAIIVAVVSGGACVIAGIAYLGIGWWFGYGRNAGFGLAMMVGSPLGLAGPIAQVVLLARRLHVPALVVGAVSGLLAVGAIALLPALMFGMANP